MGGLCEERLGGSRREWGMRDGGMEMVGGDGSETRLVTKKKGEKIYDRYRCQPNPGLQG